MKTEKVAIITGASRGIGRDVARSLAEEGYSVILVARKKDKLIELQNELAKFPGQSELIIGDITQFETISEQLDLILKQWGRCDVLVNNAGIFIDGTLDTTLEDYQLLFDTNFKAQLVFIRKVIPYMKKQGNGYVFNIASLAGKIGYANIGAYTSSKFALVGLTESLHAEYSSQGIKFTSICPGYVATDMAKGAPIPENEMIQTKDISRLIKGLLTLSSHAFVKEIIIYRPEKNPAS
jgi:3-oxoacyl-[acyl-carrier protein] reductase